MRFIAPINNIRKFPPLYPNGTEIYISQKFGAIWISDRDQVVGGKQIKKGDNVYLKVFGFIGHNGVDIAAPRYTPIIAPHNGYIVEALDGAGYGIRVSLLHEANGIQHLHVFGHLDNYKPLPKINWNLNNKSHYVRQGDKIGEVDSTGFSTGHHLHWGLYEYKNGIKQNNNNGYQGAIDPWQFVKEDTMRLVKDGSTVYLVAGDKQKVKIGIADEATLALFGDEPLDHNSTEGITETHTISTGFVVHKK
jgi:murein DD-endopeptidase MepM/ murein hydrolase activator NlpD